jgi:hypothetical protein
MDSDDQRFDGLYMNVAQTTHGIEPLLDNFFGFLRRKTDFFAGPPGSSDGTAAAIAKVNEVVEKHAVRYHKEQSEKLKINSKAPPRKPSSPANSRAATKAMEQPVNSNIRDGKEEDDIVEMGSDGDFDISQNQTPISKPVIKPLAPEGTSLQASSGGSDPASMVSSNSPPPMAVKDDKKNGGDDEEDVNDNSPPPVGNGGTVPGKYVWTQTLAEVMVTIPVPQNTRGRDLQVDIGRSHLKVLRRGNEKQVLVDADLTKSIVMDDSFWTVEDGNRLVINLQKQNQMEWWDSVCKGDPTIDVRKINPENSSLSDLDGETRKTVEKMMVREKESSKLTGVASSTCLIKAFFSWIVSLSSHVLCNMLCVFQQFDQRQKGKPTHWIRLFA